jgi:hypothetical protein
MQGLGKSARLSGMTPSELQERVDSDPHAVIMQAVHDNVFEPWAPARVRRCVRRVAAAARDGGKGTVDALLERDDELREFARLHPVIFSKVSAPEVAGSEPLMAVIEQMLKVRRRLSEGRVTEAQARAEVSDAALRAVVETGGTTPAPAPAPPPIPEEEPEPRIIELD